MATELLVRLLTKVVSLATKSPKPSLNSGVYDHLKTPAWCRPCGILRLKVYSYATVKPKFHLARHNTTRLTCVFITRTQQ